MRITQIIFFQKGVIVVMAKFENTKLGLKIKGEKLRRKEVVKCLERLDKLNEELNTKVLTDTRKSEIQNECEIIIKRLKELKALKEDTKFEKIDPNVIIKTVGLGSIALMISLIEIPGTLVNLRALKIADPIIKLLKL